jgi:hypothetical protein
MVEVLIHYSVNNSQLTIDVNKQSFKNSTNENVAKYLKGVYRNDDEFKTFIEKVSKIREEHKEFDVRDFVKEFETLYNEAKPFTYKEAFAIEDNAFKALVFGSIDVGEMIQNLGATRLKTDGKESVQKLFDKQGNFLGTTNITNVYEVYEVNGEQLGVTEKLYALKCWCTSTSNEHWLWIEENYKDQPLEAVASTFRIHSDLIDKIKEIKRQGDVLLVEIKEEFKDYEPTGEIVPLTADQYFGLLTTQA